MRQVNEQRTVRSNERRQMVMKNHDVEKNCKKKNQPKTQIEY